MIEDKATERWKERAKKLGLIVNAGADELKPELTGEEKSRTPAGSDAGDVETAGETTAADTISGPPNTKPVGADTMVKVAGTPTREEGSDV